MTPISMMTCWILPSVTASIVSDPCIIIVRRVIVVIVAITTPTITIKQTHSLCYMSMMHVMINNIRVVIVAIVTIVAHKAYRCSPS